MVLTSLNGEINRMDRIQTVKALSHYLKSCCSLCFLTLCKCRWSFFLRWKYRLCVRSSDINIVHLLRLALLFVWHPCWVSTRCESCHDVSDSAFFSPELNIVLHNCTDLTKMSTLLHTKPKFNWVAKIKTNHTTKQNKKEAKSHTGKLCEGDANSLTKKITFLSWKY